MKMVYNGQEIYVQSYKVKGDWLILRFGSYEIRLPKEVI